MLRNNCQHNMEENAWLETILNKNTNDQSIAKVLNVSYKSAVPAGSNYTSIIYRATLDVILRSGRKSKIKLIVKKVQENEVKDKSFECLSLFKEETKFYSDILSKYDQLMDDHQDNSDKLWCNMIGFKPYTVLVFEDLKAKNFVMIERTKFQDKNHALLVLNSLGRFHAMGYALIKQGLTSKEDFRLHYLERESTVLERYLKEDLEKLCDVIEGDWSPEWKETATKLREQLDDVYVRIQSLFNKDENSFQTICHGDCWTCNMMFKYCPYDESIPIAVKFLDLQTAHLNSHGFDIMYFMYTSVRVHDRTKYWNQLIGEYHKSLKSTLADYGLEADAPTLDQINAELKRLEFYGFIMNLAIMPIFIAEKSEICDVEPLSMDEAADKSFNIGINSENFKTAVQPALKKFHKGGFN